MESLVHSPYPLETKLVPQATAVLRVGMIKIRSNVTPEQRVQPHQLITAAFSTVFSVQPR